MVGVLPSRLATFSIAARRLRLAWAALSKLSSSLSAIAARTVPAQVRKSNYLGDAPVPDPQRPLLAALAGKAEANLIAVDGDVPVLDVRGNVRQAARRRVTPFPSAASATVPET
jgi:hypothetical protein